MKHTTRQIALGFLALTFILAVITIPQPVKATHTVDLTPTNITSSGLYSDVDVVGNIVAIAYRTSSSNVIVLTRSIDGGATWADRPCVGLAQCTSGTFNRLKVFIIDSDSYTIFYTTWGTGTNIPGNWLTTHDDGFTWVYGYPHVTNTNCMQGVWSPPPSIPNPVQTNYHDGGFGLVNGVPTWFSISTLRGNGSGNPTCTYITRSTDGTTFTSTLAGDVINTANGASLQTTAHITLQVDRNTGYHEVWHTQEGSAVLRRWKNGAGNNGFSVINDPITPLTAFGYGVAPCPDYTCAFFHDASTTGRVMMAVQQPGNNGNTWYFYEAQAGTVNQIQLRAAQTTTNGAAVLMSYTGGNRWNMKENADLGATFQSTSIGTTPHASFIPNGIKGVCGSLWITYQDEVTSKLALYTRNPDDVNTCAAAATTTGIPVTNLLEGDFTGDGSLLIARTDNGAMVRTFDAFDGDQLGTYATPGCDWQSHYGVSAVYTTNGYYTSFADCDVDATVTTANQVDMLRVKDATLSEDTFVVQAPCDYDAGEESTSGDHYDVPFDMNNLGQLAFYPYHGTVIQEDTGNGNACILSWTFSTISGEIGAVAVVYNSGTGSATEGDRELVLVNAGQVVGDFCSWRNTDMATTGNADFVAGVSTNGATVVARMQANYIDGSGTVVDDINLVGTVVMTNSGTWSKGNSIACAKNHALIKTDATSGNDLFFLNVTLANGNAGSSQIWAKNIGDKPLRSVALSGDGNFAAWTDTDGINVAYANNGTIIEVLATPTGTFKSMKFDNTGANLAVFTSTQIVVYHIAVITCEDDCSPTEDDTGEPIGGCTVGCSSTSTSGSGGSSTSLTGAAGGGFVNGGADNFFGINIEYISTQWGMPQDGFRWLLGLYTTALIIGAVVANRQGLVAALLAAIGGAIAVGVCVAFGLFPLWFLLLLVFLIIVMAGKLFFSENSSE
jgi:hypothetical protein